MSFSSVSIRTNIANEMKPECKWDCSIDVSISDHIRETVVNLTTVNTNNEPNGKFNKAEPFDVSLLLTDAVTKTGFSFLTELIPKIPRHYHSTLLFLVLEHDTRGRCYVATFVDALEISAVYKTFGHVFTAESLV